MQGSEQFAVFGVDDAPTRAVMAAERARRPQGCAIAIDPDAIASMQGDWPSLAGAAQSRKCCCCRRDCERDWACGAAHLAQGADKLHRLAAPDGAGGRIRRRVVHQRQQGHEPASTAPALAAFPPIQTRASTGLSADCPRKMVWATAPSISVMSLPPTQLARPDRVSPSCWSPPFRSSGAKCCVKRSSERWRLRSPAMSCCCHRPARVSTSSAITRSAASISADVVRCPDRRRCGVNSSRPYIPQAGKRTVERPAIASTSSANPSARNCGSGGARSTGSCSA